jgi:hypothetical protein
MPIRSASFTKRLADNGKALHRAMAKRMATAGASETPSELETALIEERQILKEQRAERREQALQPGPTALDRLVRTHRSEPKAKPKAGEKASEPKEAKKPKAQKTRSEKQAQKAAAAEAARKSPKKPAK